MRVFLLFLLSTLIGAFSLSAQNNAPVRKVWDKTFGGSDKDNLSVIVPSADGGYLLGGSSLSSKSGEKSDSIKGSFDYWIVKTDSNGNKLWDKTLGSNRDDGLVDILPTPDGGYLLGGTTGSDKGGDKSEESRGGEDYWIVSIDAQGNKLWDKRYGGNFIDNFSDMVATLDGGYLLGGTSYSNKGGDKSEESLVRGPTSWWNYADYWIIKIDSNGNKRWDKTFGGDEIDNLSAILPTVDGGYLLGGNSISYKNGDKSEVNKGKDFTFDYWIIKIDSIGNKLWDKTLGGDKDDELQTILATPDGGYLLGGSSFSNKSGDKSRDAWGSDDYWIVKTDSNGNKLWDKTLGGDRSDEFSTMILTSDRGYLLAGTSLSWKGDYKSEDQWGYWILQIDSQGRKIWDKTFRALDIDKVNSFLATPDRGYLLGGTSAAGKWEDKSEDCRGWVDYWIIKIAIDPTGITETAPTDLELTVYPNPSDGTLTINHPGTEALSLELMDAKGCLHRTLPVNEATTEITGLASGLYLLRFTTASGKTHTQKIVVH